MKRFGCIFLLCAGFVSAVWSQADLQPLATVKIQKAAESITLRQLKTRVEMYQKQINVPAPFTIDQKKEVLDAMIDEKLVVQAAQKAGITVTGDQVNQYFIQNISQQVGRLITEQEFASFIKQNTGKSLDEYIKEETGFANVAEFKNYLKNQLIAQQYLVSQKQGELQQVAATDKEIRDFFALNQTQFAQSEMLKLLLVIIQKGTDTQAARKKITDLYGEIKNQKPNLEDIKKRYANSTDLRAGDIFVSRTPQAAQQLHITADQLSELFGRAASYVADILETEADFQFYVVREKYPARMLTLSDVIQPDSTTTVYEYVREQLSQQKQAQFMTEAIKDITTKLRIPENYQMLKTGAALDALLNW
ncbi:MAG: SurA N-terminal domain-containing protein [Treponema sp.]|jgi:hypothetical protein|nr:SurA N-terminal domain-containing protein [Treponema sp.]